MEASFTLVLLALIAAGTVFRLWALFDVLRPRHVPYRTGTAAVWAVVVPLTHTLGALAYVAFGRSRPGRLSGSVR